MLGRIIAKIAQDMAFLRIGLKMISVSYYHRMQTAFKGLELLLNLSLLKPRMIKDETEIGDYSQGLFHLRPLSTMLLDFTKPGKTEIEIANFLDFRMRELGCYLSLTRF